MLSHAGFSFEGCLADKVGDPFVRVKVRHRCHNRRCVNPRHLEVGDRADNLRDEWERQANGVDFALL
ncbi:hypothetical protein [Seohaeicola zhoushanensis]|uniref:hypothetical protein n=1 Tax=Seohaeicola zhoushanensis TaxID=1569283 RepID=UPI00357128BD